MNILVIFFASCVMSMALRPVAMLLVPPGAKGPEHSLSVGRYGLDPSEESMSSSAAPGPVATLFSPLGLGSPEHGLSAGRCGLVL